MKKAINHPQLLFIFLAIIILVSGFLNQDGVIKIAIYGTYMDLKTWTLCLFSAIYFVLIAVNYASLTITQRTPKRALTITHIVLQIISLLPLLYFVFISEDLASYEEVSRMNFILISAFVLFILASVIHIINFVASLLAKKD